MHFSGGGRPQPRMLVVAGLFAGLFALMVARAVDLAVVRGDSLAQLAARQHRQRVGLVPHRGAIVDRHGEALALSVEVPSIYLRPREFAGQEGRLAALARALGLPRATVGMRFGSAQPFVWLKRQALPREAHAVEELGLRGVAAVAEPRRFYPHHHLAAHVLGFVGVDSQGLEGLEHQLDAALRGEPVYLEVDRDARGGEMFTRGVERVAAQGSRVELTIDAAIQDAAERELLRGVSAARAKAGVAVVLDARSGEVLALANVPTFDPNGPPAAIAHPRARDRVRNRAITDPYEPGSTFKAVLAAAAVAEGVVAPDELLFCENGRLRVGRWPIRDVHPHGWLSFAQVIQYSSNIGASKVAERLGAERYHRYLRAFGFGSRTGIELPGESPGILRPVERWARIDLATHSFGQGIAVTPLQMAVAFAAIANGGNLMRPYLVGRVLAASGEILVHNEPRLVRRVVDERAARTVTEFLRRAVEEPGGTGGRARLEAYAVAGKTGTAQKASTDGRGYSAERIGSFIGFVPAEAPRVVIAVLIDEPGTSSYGGVVAAPVFRAIAEATLQRLGVAPSPRWAPAEPPPVEVARRPRRGDPHPPPRIDTAQGAPNLLGLSLREALARAHAAGWGVRVTGTGYVRGQTPRPGALARGERRLLLRLVPAEVAVLEQGVSGSDGCRVR
jgi:cell division protein FtsI (penicillin-binding protein 3)